MPQIKKALLLLMFLLSVETFVENLWGENVSLSRMVLPVDI